MLEYIRNNICILKEKKIYFKMLIMIFFILIPIFLEIGIFGKGKINFYDSYVRNRIIYQYIILSIIFLFYLLNFISNKIKKVFEYAIKYRYFIALFVFFIFIIFKLNFSNIGVWNDLYKTENKINTTLIGKSRSIRSDEWCVQTPFFLAQTFSKNYYPLINKNIRLNGQNMLMIYPAPVFNITIIGKPQNIGFFIFGRDYGFSWYWITRLLFLILMAIELAIIFTKRDPILSIIGGLWLAFSPAIQWWSSSNLDIYMHGFAIMVIFHYFVTKVNWEIWKKILLAIGMISSFVGFVLCFYPPIQIPLMYLIFSFILISFIKNFNTIKKKDYIIIFFAIILIIFILGYYFIISINDINLVKNTIYPGARDSIGGSGNFKYFINQFINLFTPFFGGINLELIQTNKCEVASSIYPFIGLIIVSILYIIDIIKNKNKDKYKDENKVFFITFFSIYLLQIYWILIGFGKILSNITLFSLSTENRMFCVSGIIGIILCIMIMKKFEKNKKITKKYAYTISFFVLIIAIFVIKYYKYDMILDINKLIIVSVVLFFMTYNFLRFNKKEFCYIIAIVSILTGLIINPIEVGTKSLYSTKFSEEIQKINKNDSDSIWAADKSMDAQYIIANGSKVINGVNYYPNYEWLKIIDKDGKYENIYNRYAHIYLKLSNENKFELLTNDSYRVYMNYESLKEINIKYYVTDELLNDITIKDFKLELIFFNDIEKKYIYIIK